MFNFTLKKNPRPYFATYFCNTLVLQLNYKFCTVINKLLLKNYAVQVNTVDIQHIQIKKQLI